MDFLEQEVFPELIPEPDDKEQQQEENLATTLKDRLKKKKPRLKIQISNNENNNGNDSDDKKSTNIAHRVENSASWQTLLAQSCPYLMKMVKKEGKVNVEKLKALVKKLNIQPCEEEGKCLERNCAILWQYYVNKKQKSHRKLKKCGGTLVKGKYYDPYCVESQKIATQLFQEHKDFQFTPADIEFLYELQPLKNAHRTRNTLQKLQKKSGDVVLKTTNKVRDHEIRGTQIIRVLLLNHQILQEYFVKLYSVHFQIQGVVESKTGVNKQPRPVNAMYTLMEAMSGNMFQYVQHYYDASHTNTFYYNKLQRMLYHAMIGLKCLNDLGYRHNDVKPENLMFKVDWDHDLVDVKFVDFESVTPMDEMYVTSTIRIIDPQRGSPYDSKQVQQHRARQNLAHHDRFAFGILVYELIFGHHPAGNIRSVNETWALGYQVVYDEKTDTYKSQDNDIHKNIRKLLSAENYQPMATVAYHFILNEFLYKGYENEKRWNWNQAVQYVERYHSNSRETSDFDHLPTPHEEY